MIYSTVDLSHMLTRWDLYKTALSHTVTGSDL